MKFRAIMQFSPHLLLILFLFSLIQLVFPAVSDPISTNSSSVTTTTVPSPTPTPTQPSTQNSTQPSANSTVSTPNSATNTPSSSGNSTFPASDRVIVGYWETSQLAVNNLFWDKITHVNFAFALLDKNYAPYIDPASSTSLTTLVWYAHVYNVKVLLSVGGWTGSRNFSLMASDASNRAAFINATMSMVKQYNLDGIDIDWEYPGRQGLKCNIVNPQNDTSNFLLLLNELRSALGKDKLLTLAVRVQTFDGPSGPVSDVSGFASVVDWVNVMPYDISVDDGSGEDWTKVTGPNAPFNFVPGKGRQFSFTQAGNAWLKAGMPASKIVMGVEFMGREQTALSQMTDSQFVPRDPIVPLGDNTDALWADPCPGSQQVYSGVWKWRSLREEGLLKCTLTAADGTGWTRNFDNVTQTPWLYNSATKGYISYDDPESLYTKIEYTIKQGFRGMMIWELSLDNGHELLDVMQSLKRDDSTPPVNDCSSGTSIGGNAPSYSGGKGATNKLSAGAVVGITLGSVVVFLLAGFGLLYYKRKAAAAAASNRPRSIAIRAAAPGMVDITAGPTIDIPTHKKYVIAVFDYTAKEKGDLSFKKGDLIEVLEKGEGPNDWWVGRINDMVGEFPGNYVKDEF